MTQEQFRHLMKCGRISIVDSQFANPLPSATDPTQDIPVKNIQLAANGIPINVMQQKWLSNGTKADNLCAIDMRNTDKFDAVGELQHLERTTADKINKQKQLKQIEENAQK